MNVQLLINFTIFTKQRSQTIKSWIWTFISQCVYAMYVKLWDIKYLKFRTLKVHLVNETLS
jgi:hypothetical protein